MKKSNANEAVKEITKKLEAGVHELFESDRYAEYLAFMSKFTRYSINNSLLIWMQKPDATLVAGYKAWQTKFKRQVRKGEKGIRILAPIPRKYTKEVTDADGNVTEEEVSYVRFKAISVFDVSQTDGEELPSIAVDALDGTVEGFESLWGKLIQVTPASVKYEQIEGNTNGYYNPKEKCIAVKEGMSELQTIKTLIHEIAHSLLHGKGNEQEDATRNEAEVQAESVAYTVCSYLGLDTSDYSFGYVTGWSEGKETKELTAGMETIRKTACKIIDGIAA